MEKQSSFWPRYGTLVVLAVLCAGVAAYLGLRGRGSPAGPAGTERLLAGVFSPEGALVAPPDAGLVAEAVPGVKRVQIVIEHHAPGGELTLVSLRRYQSPVETEWTLESPYARADDEVAEQMYRTLLGAVVRRRVPGARAEAGRYGLQPERARLRVRLPAGHELLLGDDADGGLVYAARDREPDVLLVEHAVYEALARDREGLVMRSLTMPAVVKRARSWQIGPLNLVRHGGGAGAVPAASMSMAPPASGVFWTVAEAGRATVRARQDRIDGLLAMLASARATRVVTDTGALPVRPPELVVKANGRDQFGVIGPCPPATPGAAGPDEVLISRPDGARLCFARGDVARVGLPPSPLRYEDLREARLLPFPAREVRRVAFGKSVLTQRPGGAWEIDGRPADPDAVRGYLDRLGEVIGQGDAAGPGPGEATQIEVATEGDRVVLRTWDRGRAGVLVQRDEEPLVTVDAGVAELLRPEPLRFWQRQALALPPHQVRGLRIVRTGGVTERAERAGTGDRGPIGEGWRVVEPAAVPADAEHMTRLLGALGELRVTRWLAPPGADRDAKGPAQVRLSIEGTGGAGPGAVQTIALGPADRQGCAVRVAEGALGLLPPEACADLSGLLPTRAVLLLDDARLRRVEADGRPRWPAADAAERDRLLGGLHALSQARADVLHYGPPPRTAHPVAHLVVELAPAPVPAGALPASTVAPERQDLTLYRDAAGALLARVSGRDLTYRLPPAAAGPVLAALAPANRPASAAPR